MSAPKPLHDVLTAKLVARLAMRWKQSHAYVPSGSTTVHCPGELADDDRAAFDSYVIGYQDAIEDIVRYQKGADAEPQPYALHLAENSVFQAGSLPRRSGSVADRGSRKPAKGQGVRRNLEARRQLESLFRGGDDEV